MCPCVWVCVGVKRRTDDRGTVGRWCNHLCSLSRTGNCITGELYLACVWGGGAASLFSVETQLIRRTAPPFKEPFTVNNICFCLSSWIMLSHSIIGRQVCASGHFRKHVALQSLNTECVWGLGVLSTVFHLICGKKMFWLEQDILVAVSQLSWTTDCDDTGRIWVPVNTLTAGKKGFTSTLFNLS